MPSGRTVQYAMWKACERLRLRPKDVKEEWEDNTPYVQSLLIAYSQIRDVEDAEKCVSRL